MGKRSTLRLAAVGALAFMALAAAQIGEQPAIPAYASTIALGGINVEPAARPWQYIGANPDGWWCPTASTCTTSNPLGRIDTEMALAEQLHVANIRIEVPWFLVEPARGTYSWARADYIFSSAAAHGMTLQPIFVYTPTWDGGYNAFPPAADFGSFVSAFMARYGSRINAVEMWNEPDGGQSLAANNPAQYVQSILIPGFNAVKAGHPSVAVIEGGSINDSGVCCPWLSGIYAAGGGNYFDTAAFHDYGGNYASVVNAYRSILNSHGQSNKPIWLGEYGVSDATGSQQSSLINAALTATPGLAMAQFYTLRDESVYTCCPPAATGEHKLYGVVAADDVTKKSSFYQMQSLLNGSSPPPTSQPTSEPTSQPTSTATSAPTSPSVGAHASPKPGQSPSSLPSARSTPSTHAGSSSIASNPTGPGSPGATTLASHQSPNGSLIGMEIVLVAIGLGGLALATWGVAFATGSAVVGAQRINARLGSNRPVVAAAVVLAGVAVAVAAGVMLPIR